MRGWLALAAAAAAACDGGPKGDGQPARAEAKVEPAAETTPAPPKPDLTPWSHPRRACEVLSKHGFKTSAWLQRPGLPEGQEHYCTTVEPRPAAADPSFRLSYGAVGGAEAKAFVLKLAGPAGSPKAAEARAEFAGVVMALADSGWHMADGQPKEAAALKAAVTASKPGSWPAGGFNRVEVARPTGPGEALTVTFFDPRAKPARALGALP